MLLSNMPALQVVVPLMFAPICALLPSARLAWLLTAVVCWIAFAISVWLFSGVFFGEPLFYSMGGWEPPLGIGYRVDSLSAFMLCIVTGIASVTIVYAKRSVLAEVALSKQPLFYTTFLLCLTGLLGIIITDDAFNIYVFLEISSLSTYALIAMGNDRRALFASFEYLILGTIGATFILIAVGLLYMMTGTLNISDLGVRVAAMSDQAPVKAALAFFMTGLALKIAVFPLHLWLTNAYANAPSFISAFLAATATKVGIYVFIRVVFSIFGYEYSFFQIPMGTVFITLSMFAIIVASLVAVFQHNIKRMLAYSSVAQIGYIMLGLAIATQESVAAALIHLFTHALSKGALFMAVGCVAYVVGGVRLIHFRGIGKRMPLTMAAFVIAGFSLIGFPLTAGFVSKWYLLWAVFNEGIWLAFVMIIVSSLLSVVYIWRVIEVAYFQEPAADIPCCDRVPISMLASLWVMVLLCVVFGLYTAPTVGFAEHISKYLFSL